MKNGSCIVALLVMSLSAMATLSQGRRLMATEAASAQPQDFFYDNPWIPDPVKGIAAPFVPYIGPIGYPPNPKAPGAPPSAIDCGPFLPPFLCGGAWGWPPAAPAPPSPHP